MDDDQAELRRRYREYCREYHRWLQRREEAREAYMRALKAEVLTSALPPAPEQTPPPFPEECRGLRCGARTRAGTPCNRTDRGAGGRCKLHGGMSTGPRTDKGKERASRNSRRERTP